MKKIIFFALVLFTFCSCKEEKKPNVIFILTDQWRANALGYAGDTIVKTPELDKFASASVNFENAVSVTPVCTPYRAALLTGRFPTSTGMFLNDIYLPAEELTMAEIYKAANYKTAYLGKWHLDGHGRKDNVEPERRQGFEYWKGSECNHNYKKEHYYENDDPEIKYWKGYSTYAISKEAQSYMEKHADDENPFLLFVSMGTPHFPHQSAPKEYKKMYTPDKLTLPENVTDSMQAWALKEIQGYYAHCTATDKAIGEIINKAKELGIYDNSIIVFTSDHGEMMGSHGYRPYMKHQPYAESAEIPFLVSYPNIAANKGKIAEAPITTTDILPSLLTLSGLEIPKSIEGYDLSEIFKSPEKNKDRAALFMNPSPFDIAYPDDEYRAIKTAKYTYVKTPKGPSMLFDNDKDPFQLKNLIGDPSFAAQQEQLDKILMDELKRIGETEIKTREYYFEKFGFSEKKDLFRPNLAVKNYGKVKVAISPRLINNK